MPANAHGSWVCTRVPHPTYSVPLSPPKTTGIFGLAAASACGSKSWCNFWVIFSLVRLPSESLAIPLPVTSKVRHPLPNAVPQPPGWADTSSTKGLRSQGKALLGWRLPAHHCLSGPKASEGMGHEVGAGTLGLLASLWSVALWL